MQFIWAASFLVRCSVAVCVNKTKLNRGMVLDWVSEFVQWVFDCHGNGREKKAMTPVVVIVQRLGLVAG